MTDTSDHPTTPPTTPPTGRLQLALNVDDLDASVAFYTALLGVPPTKTRPGYANFAVAEPPFKLVLLENPGAGGTLNHLGVEVPDTDTVDAVQRRLHAAGLTSRDERSTTCCYAMQDKFWVDRTPDGERWEIYTVLADAPAQPTTAQPTTAQPTTAEAIEQATEQQACCA